MPERPLDSMRVAILVSDDFEQEELTEPMEALADAGADVRIVSPIAGTITGMKYDEKKDRFNIDFELDRVSPDEFDGVMLPGGVFNSDFLRQVPKAQEFVKKMDADGKPMAIIGHAPWLLVSAGLVKGRTLTSYETIEDDIRNAGGDWVEQEVIRDRNWVTAQEPGDLQTFNREMLNMFAELKQPARRAA